MCISEEATLLSRCAHTRSCLRAARPNATAVAVSCVRPLLLLWIIMLVLIGSWQIMSARERSACAFLRQLGRVERLSLSARIGGLSAQSEQQTHRASLEPIPCPTAQCGCYDRAAVVADAQRASWCERYNRRRAAHGKRCGVLVSGWRAVVLSVYPERFCLCNETEQ